MHHFRSPPHIFPVRLNANATHAKCQTSLFDPILECWRENIQVFSLIAWSWFDWKSLRQSLLDGGGQEIDFQSFNRITIFLELNVHTEWLKSRRDAVYFDLFSLQTLCFLDSAFGFSLTLFRHAKKHRYIEKFGSIYFKYESQFCCAAVS